MFFYVYDMNIYRNIKNKKIYTIENLILDIHFLNGNANAGIYAKPYKWKGGTITYKSKDENERKVFVNQNFVKIAELYH